MNVDVTNAHELLVDTNLYYATFDFPETCKYPSLTVRANSTLINPLSSQMIAGWIWGVQLRIAAQRQDCRVRLLKVIRYRAGTVFKNFIETLYEARREAIRNGDDVLDGILKLASNSSYGKLG